MVKHWKKVIAILAMVASVSATETRVATMGGDVDLLINDEQNVTLYPSTVLNFGKMATLEFGTLPSWNMGTYPAGLLITNNNKMAFGILGNRPIYMTNHPTNPLRVNAYSFVLGMGMGNLNLGVQVNMGMRNLSQTPAKDTTYSYNAMFLGIMPGISYTNDNMGIDASLNFAMPHWKDEGYTAPTDTLKFAGIPTIGMNFRFFNGSRTQKTIAAMHINFFKDAYEQNGTTFSNGSTWDIDAKIGKYMHPMRWVNIIGGLNLNVENVSINDSTGSIAINSGFLLGGETLVSSKLGFRTGITRNIFTYNKNKNGSTSNSTMGFADAPLNVAIGAYLNVGSNVRIDANIAHDLLFNGPYFLTGTPSQLASTVSAIVKF